MGQLEGRVAVVTGGGSGIGRACAIRFAKEGASVVVDDINDEAATQTVADIEADAGTALAVHLDATSPASNEALMSAAVDTYGKLDALVAAAGVSHARYVTGESNPRASASLLEQSVDDWRRVIDVNLTGVMLADQHAARVMVAAGGGTIVNLSSALSKVPLAGSVDYCVSKAGIWMLTKAFALEVIDRGVRVNAIGPGVIDTPMAAGMLQSPDADAFVAGLSPMGRPGDPAEVASAAVFLSSPESSYITGQIVFPAGGLFVG